MKLSEIAKMPEKIQVKYPTDEEVGNGAYYDIKKIEGYNQAISDCLNIEVEADVESLRKIIEKHKWQKAANVFNKDIVVDDLAQEIITKMPKWIVK